MDRVDQACSLHKLSALLMTGIVIGDDAEMYTVVNKLDGVTAKPLGQLTNATL
jgi:hypothetical protein